MERVERTVFISYRRTNLPWALAIYQNLTSTGYDVFFDYEGINPGDFESQILDNVISRAHFLVLLTPSALERCNEPEDWLRREIETALESKRNIVPLMLEGFSFGTPAIATQLTGTLTPLKQHQALDIPPSYFFEAMERLRNRFLNIALTAVPHPVPASAQQAATEQKAAANAAPAVQEEELTAQQYYERAITATDPNEQLRFYSEAIRLQPDLAVAFNNRGFTRKAKGDLEGAIEDYNEAIRLKPDIDLTIAFLNRGSALQAKGDFDGAIADYNEVIRLKPDNAKAFYSRGGARYFNGDFDGAIADSNEAIWIEPDHALAFNNRGNARKATGDLDNAIADYNEAIRLKPDLAMAFYNRGNARKAMGDLDDAIADYNETIRLKSDITETFYNRADIFQQQDQPAAAIADFRQYLELGGGDRNGNTADVEQMIADLTKKL